jgi:hypothetical protein
MGIPLAVCVVGGIVHVLASENPTRCPAGLAELGRLAFGIGLFVYLFRLT